MARLRQILVRLKHDPVISSVTRTPLIVNLADELKVNADQRKEFDALVAAHVKATERAILNNDFYASYHGIRTANAELDKGLTDTLTAEQRTKLKELVGEPMPGAARRPTSPVTEKVLQQREGSFGLYAEELTFLNTIKSIQTELKLTKDQLDYTKKQVAAFNKLFGLGFGSKTKGKKDDNPAETAKSKSNFITESLSILDAQQAKRFREIMIQYHERPRRPLSSEYHSGLTYPGVAEELKLTAEQKKRVLNGDRAVDVLTEAQWKTFRAMFGEKYTGDFSRTLEYEPNFGLGSTPLRAYEPYAKEREQASFLMVMPWSVLNLKPEQQTQLAAALNTYNLKTPSAFEREVQLAKDRDRLRGANPWAPNSTPRRDDPRGNATPKRSTDDIISLKGKFRRIFGGDVPARVDQLMLQSRAAVNLRTTLELPEVKKALQLTPVQINQFTELDESFVELMELVTSSPLAFESRTAILTQLRNQLDMRILAALRPDQLAKWKEMIGEPYDGFKKSEIRRISPRFELHR